MSNAQDQPNNDKMPSQESPQDTSNQDIKVSYYPRGERYIRAENEE